MLEFGRNKKNANDFTMAGASFKTEAELKTRLKGEEAAFRLNGEPVRKTI